MKHVINKNLTIQVIGNITNSRAHNINRFQEIMSFVLFFFERKKADSIGRIAI